MESLCAYDSSSSSDDNESPINKKRKVAEIEPRNSVREAAGHIRQPENKMSKPSVKTTTVSGITGSKVFESKQITTFCASNHRGSTNRFEYQVACKSNQNRNTPAFVGVVPQKRHPNSNISGSSVKPYVSKRERERMTQTNATTSASTAPTFAANHHIEKTVCDVSLKGARLNSELKTKISSKNSADVVCRPPQKLQLNLEGHSQGVNCVRWNPSEGNLLMSASMDHIVSVWDTHKGGSCTRRLTRHTEAVKDARWSLCGSQVLSCSYDKTARLFNLETGIAIIVG